MESQKQSPCHPCLKTKSIQVQALHWRHLVPWYIGTTFEFPGLLDWTVVAIPGASHCLGPSCSPVLGGDFWRVLGMQGLTLSLPFCYFLKRSHLHPIPLQVKAPDFKEGRG